ncbi:MAG: hypothetical protein KC417_02465, partial [Myxococcales bacterium]|nr:hypothetical protein [Myxococcales bacterium]
MRKPFEHARLLWIALACLTAPGCDSPLAEGLTEAQANEVVVALGAEGVASSKEATSAQGDKPAYRINVPSGDVPSALAALEARGLPRTNERGFEEIYAEASFVPTPTEERAKYVAGLSGELARSLRTLDGVLDARVHIALPERASLLDVTTRKPRASVLLKVAHGSAGPDPAAVRKLVGGAVDDLDEANVAVVVAPALNAARPAPGVAKVGPFSVSHGSAALLRIALGVLL